MIFINILICGEYGAFSEKLISRLKQEQHEIFVITGRKWEIEKKVKNVFQEYNFEYTSSGVINIIHNVKPDLVIFMGALDEHFEWRIEGQQSGEYISGLTNILIASLNAGVRRFFYCSSLEIFEDNKEIEIKNETIPTPLTIKTRTFLQGEDTCKYYHKPGVFDISIIRFCEMYGGFMNQYIQNSPSTKLILDMLSDKEISLCREKQYNLIYLDDGVEALYRSIDKKIDQFSIIHVLGESCIEQDILTYVHKYTNREIQIKEEIENNTKEKIWKRENFETIEGFHCKYTLEEGLNKFLNSDIRKEKKAISRKRAKKRFLESRTLALVETILLTVLAGILSIYIKDTLFGNHVDFYLLIVVLISVIHGSLFGVLAIILSIVFKFGAIIASLGVVSLVVDHGQYLWMLQLLIIGGVVSFTTDLYKRKALELSEEMKYMEEELDNMNRINDSNVYVKNIYEKRLINYKNSLAKIYDITSMLDHLSTQKIIFEAVEVVMQVMEAKEVSIYISSDNSNYLRLMASTSKEARKMGKSILINENHLIQKGINEEGYYRNKDLNPDYPMLAGAVTENEQTKALIMVWDLKLEGANLYQANLLAILCKLIEKSMRQASVYMEAIKADTYLEGSRALRPDSFKQILSMYKEGLSKKLLEFALIQVFPKDTERNLNQLIRTVEENIRLTDYLGVDGMGQLYVLLTNSSDNELKFITDRFEKHNITCEVVGK